MSKVSIIIVMQKNWELTRVCLRTLAKATAKMKPEILLMDITANGKAAAEYPDLGKSLFGSNFRYVEAICNFATAANMAARLANNELLLFLNNANEISHELLDPLIADFRHYPDLAGTTPVVLKRRYGFPGNTILALGLSISPYFEVTRLYEGIPQDAPLAKKRRFLQAVSGICLMMKKSVFQKAGGFDERFNNGFEDVDLCSRLTARGYRFTVNPDARIVYCGYQEQNNSANQEDRNLFNQGNLSLLKPDLRELVAADGLELKLNRWQQLTICLPQKLEELLETLLPRLNYDRLYELLIQNPYWQNGWSKLTELEGENNYQISEFVYELFKEPEFCLKRCAAALDNIEGEQAWHWLKRFEPFSATALSYDKTAKYLCQWMKKHNQTWLAEEYSRWLENEKIFQSDTLVTALEFYLRFNHMLTQINEPQNPSIYAAWIESANFPARKRFLESKKSHISKGPGITLIIPLIKAGSERLKLAVKSIVSQNYKNWQLLVVTAKDCSGVSDLPEDKRIQILEEAVTDTASALNIAVQKAIYPWVTIIDQDGMLTDDALELMAYAIMKTPRAILFYSDEDQIDDEFNNLLPYFKSCWNPILAPFQNYLHRLTVYSRERVLAFGFRSKFGSAYEYDFNLRYCRSLNSSDIAHVAEVLHHTQADANLEVIGINAQKELATNAQNALNEYLSAAVPGARVKLKEKNLLKIVWPKNSLKICVICNMDGAPRILIRAFCQDWHAADEILLLNAINGDYGASVRVMAQPDGMDEIEALHWVVNQTDCDVIGFVKKEVRPANADWVDEFAGFAQNYPAGAWAGKISQPDGCLLHGGYLGDCFGNLRPIFQNANIREQDWFNWTSLDRKVLAVGGECLFTHRDTFLKNQGLDHKTGEWAFQDYCLRLEKQELMNGWLADAKFTLTQEMKLPLETDGFITKWLGDFRAFNENLIIVKSGLGLTRYPKILGVATEGLPSFSTREYCRLYFNDGNLLGLEPVEHYLDYTNVNGFKTQLSRLDYSAHTNEMREKFAQSGKSGIVVCTALTGAYEKLLPPLFINMDWRYVCYTDEAREGWGIWEMREIPYQNEDPRRRARWIKTNLPKLFPDARRVIWIDANIIITSDLEPVIAARDDCPLALVAHSSRDCAYAEGDACIAGLKDSEEIIRTQLAAYETEGLPHHAGLYETNIMLLDPKNEMVKKIFAEWSEEIMRHSRRDQISLPYVLYKNSFTPCNLLTTGVNMRNYEGCEYLMHNETRWIREPQLNQQTR